METNEQVEVKLGDFTNLANNYAKYRPGYSETVLKAVLGIVNKPLNELDFVDVGAGTGIWTRMVASQHCKSATAVEPNDAMRRHGQVGNGPLSINWMTGSAESTTLPDQSADLLSMASSFHWTHFESAIQEFHRVLKPNGHFLMLWNPRYLDNSPLLLEIENYIYELNPKLNRVSSGKSKLIDQLANRLEYSPLFTDMIYLEGKHTVALEKNKYIGIWKSVNDVRNQLGEDKFQQFIDYLHKKLENHTLIDCTYQTRAWIMKKNVI